MARDSFCYVRLIVAKNPNVPISLLKKLAFDENYLVRNASVEAVKKNGT